MINKEKMVTLKNNSISKKILGRFSLPSIFTRKKRNKIEVKDLDEEEEEDFGVVGNYDNADDNSLGDENKLKEQGEEFFLSDIEKTLDYLVEIETNDGRRNFDAPNETYKLKKFFVKVKDENNQDIYLEDKDVVWRAIYKLFQFDKYEYDFIQKVLKINFIKSTATRLMKGKSIIESILSDLRVPKQINNILLIKLYPKFKPIASFGYKNAPKLKIEKLDMDEASLRNFYFLYCLKNVIPWYKYISEYSYAYHSDYPSNVVEVLSYPHKGGFKTTRRRLKKSKKKMYKKRRKNNKICKMKNL